MQAVAVGTWAYQTSFQILEGNQAGLFGISQNQNTGMWHNKHLCNINIKKKIIDRSFRAVATDSRSKSLHRSDGNERLDSIFASHSGHASLGDGWHICLRLRILVIIIVWYYLFPLMSILPLSDCKQNLDFQKIHHSIRALKHNKKRQSSLFVQNYDLESELSLYYFVVSSV